MMSVFYSIINSQDLHNVIHIHLTTVMTKQIEMARKATLHGTIRARVAARVKHKKHIHQFENVQYKEVQPL